MANNGEMVWDEEFLCPRVNDVLFATPIREYRPEVAAPPQEAPAAAEQQPPHEQPQSSGRRKRNLTASLSLERKYYCCKLFRCEESAEIILEMQEVDTEDKTFYVLNPCERAGKKRIESKETRVAQRAISPVVEEIYPDFNGNKTNLSIDQRLEGKWIVELRERVGSMKFERFYSHERVDKTFRSMNDVATFIVYNVY